MSLFYDADGRRIVAFLMFALALMGWCYLSLYAAGQNPVTEDLFGPRVYAIPGWVWALWQGGFASIACLGAMRGDRLGAWMLLVGSLCLAAMFLSFAFLAGEAPRGLIVVAGSMFVTLPVAVVGFHVAKGALTDAG